MPEILKPGDFLDITVPVNLKVDSDETAGLFFEVRFRRDVNAIEKKVCLLRLEDWRTGTLDLPYSPEDFAFFNGQIVFKVYREDNTVFYSYDNVHGRSRELAVLPFLAGDFIFTDRKIYFTADVQRPDGGSAVYAGDRSPFFQEGRGVTGDCLNCLFRAESDGTDVTVISPLDVSVGSVDFDIPSRQIVYTAKHLQKNLPVSSHIYRYDLEREETSVLSDGNLRISYIKSLSSRRVVFFAADLDTRSRNDNHRLYFIDPLTGDRGILSELPDLSNEHPSIVTDSFYSDSVPLQYYGGYLYFKLVGRDRDLLYRTDGSGETEYVECPVDSIGAFQVTGKGILLLAMKDLAPGELYLSVPGKTERLTDLHGKFREASLSRPDRITFTCDEREIDGYVYPPAVKQDGAEYPAVLFIHGGPKMIYGPVYSHDIQMLCASGYYVFCANPMGSDGRGDDFAGIGGQMGELPFRQLMDFTDEVLRRYPSIDPHRLGVTGGSYGGYMTNYIVTRTDRFRAAVSERGISSLMTSFNNSDIGTSFVYEYMGNGPTPWTDPEAYRKESPLSRACHVRTPVLFIHGREDYRCHYSESLNMFNALNYFGVDTRFALFPGESHSLTVRGKPESRKQRYREMLSWFDRYLKSKGEVEK